MQLPGATHLPVLELLRGYFDIHEADDAAMRREKARTALGVIDRALSDALPYLFGLLGIQDTPDPLAQMDPQIRRRRTLDALRRIFICESLDQPLVLIFEDLHWIDSETQALLDLLADSIANARVLLLVNYRPGVSARVGKQIQLPAVAPERTRTGSRRRDAVSAFGGRD